MRALSGVCSLWQRRSFVFVLRLPFLTHCLSFLKVQEQFCISLANRLKVEFFSHEFMKSLLQWLSVCFPREQPQLFEADRRAHSWIPYLDLGMGCLRGWGLRSETRSPPGDSDARQF